MQKRIHSAFPLFDGVIPFFVLFCMVFFPLRAKLLPFQSAWADTVFGDLISSIADILLPGMMKVAAVSSDSLSLYLLTGVFLVLAVLVSLVNVYLPYPVEAKKKVFQAIRLFGFYYLALHMMRYGCDKVFKGQFYLPEPNILYTSFGAMGKDLLYWSTLGTSRGYNIFLGMTEVIAALLLLHRKWRTTGLLLCIAILVNVVAVNFSFDISVKLLSSFLLLLSVFLLLPDLPFLFGCLVKKLPGSIVVSQPFMTVHPFLRGALKFLIPAFIILEGLYPYLMTGNFNDDRAARPILHGAYEIQQVATDGTEEIKHPYPYTNLFIHRAGYIIFQDTAGRMQDFKLDVYQGRSCLVLTDYSGRKIEIKYQYDNRDSLLRMNHYYENRKFFLKAKAMNWKALPALQPSFHWTVDGAGH